MNPSPKKWGNGYAAYIRVSTAKQGEHGVSLQEQKEAIKRYAERSNLSVAAWFEERETAAKGGRPLFSQMLKQLRKAQFRGLLVHKIDRSARNLRDWAELGQLIDQGIEVHFCHEGLDLNSRGGRLSADIQAVVAADFIRNLREETRKGVYGRLKQGLYPFRAPIGYRDCGGGKPKEPDPATAPLVRWAFARYASGTVNFEMLREELLKRGLRSRNGGRLSLNGLTTLLNNPFYTGQIRIFRTGETFMGVHEPLISVSLFEQIQSVLKGKRQHRGLRHDFLFRRMFACRLCGKSLIGERVKGHVYYRCHTKGCPTTGVREEAIEASIEERFSAIQISEEETAELEQVFTQLRADWSNEKEHQSKSLAMQFGQIQQRLDRLTDAFVDGLLDRETFTDRKARLVRDQQVLKGSLTALSTDATAITSRFEKFLERAKTAYLSYQSGDPFQKREILKTLTSNRWIERKNVVLELFFPFLALENWRAIPLCDPYRDSSRTLHEDAGHRMHSDCTEARLARLREIVEAVALSPGETTSDIPAQLA